jgi:glycine/D-amino acid oxidase-like deaminating enzyme
MRVAVIGAGIIGVTTAYELAADGHEVTVFERRGAAAEETSFANAGVVAPGYVTPWAAPGMPAKVLAHLLSRHAPVKLGLPLSGANWPGCGAGGAPAGWRPTRPTAPACSAWRSTAGSGCTR